MSRRNKDIDQRIQEELKYSEYLNKRVKEIKKKAKSGKEKSINKKNNYQFMTEFKYLQAEQRKLENELVIQLYNINENENKSDSSNNNSKMQSDEILNFFYCNSRMEKEISKDFNVIFALTKNMIHDKNAKDKENLNTINQLITDLKSTNDELIDLSEEDFKFLTTPSYVTTNDSNNNENKNDFISLLFLNDSDNILNINEIDYLIGQELFQSEQLKHLNFTFKHSNYYLYNNLNEKISNTYFTPPIVNYVLPLNLKEKTLLLMGNEEGNANIKKIEKSFELVNIKYKNDYNNLIKELNQNLTSINNEFINTYIKLRCSNYVYFMKNNNINTHLN